MGKDEEDEEDLVVHGRDDEEVDADLRQFPDDSGRAPERVG